MHIKEKIDKLGFKTKNFCASKVTIKKGKRQHTEWEKIFANLIRDLYLKYIKNAYNSIIQITQFKNWAKVISPRKIYKWPISS